jgi:phosphoglycerol transferase MdoB-like AlkP superfamily enzyme
VKNLNNEFSDLSHTNKNQKTYLLPHKNSWQYFGAILGAIFLTGFGIFLFYIGHTENTDITDADMIPFTITLCGILLGYGYNYMLKIGDKSESVYDQNKIRTHSLKEYVIINIVRTASIIILALIAYNIYENIRAWIDEKPLQVIIVLLFVIAVFLYNNKKK